MVAAFEFADSVTMGSVTTFMNGDGEGSFAPGVDIATNIQATWVHLVDMNRDGYLDILSTSLDGEEWRVAVRATYNVFRA